MEEQNIKYRKLKSLLMASEPQAPSPEALGGRIMDAIKGRAEKKRTDIHLNVFAWTTRPLMRKLMLVAAVFTVVIFGLQQASLISMRYGLKQTGLYNAELLTGFMPRVSQSRLLIIGSGLRYFRGKGFEANADFYGEYPANIYMPFVGQKENKPASDVKEPFYRIDSVSN